jgi:hypothetical protein
MAKTVVAFWNCTKSEHWSEASFKNKLTSLHAATFTSQVEVDSKMGKQSRVDTWIFTGFDPGVLKNGKHVAKSTEKTDVLVERLRGPLGKCSTWNCGRPG